jgi:hypothetical protein
LNNGIECTNIYGYQELEVMNELKDMEDAPLGMDWTWWFYVHCIHCGRHRHSSSLITTQESVLLGGNVMGLGWSVLLAIPHSPLPSLPGFICILSRPLAVLPIENIGNVNLGRRKNNDWLAAFY